ncbi:unnamed protein product [Adineta ricciae]|uniref:Uncharacterized protein n=1 Tax=Adineta ricciae TaxID=249248 RepID=A0A815IRE4_ADIRI|nr:unnamed protein product [Adineta ricciae]
MGQDYLNKIISNGISPVSISISSLNDENLYKQNETTTTYNKSILIVEFTKEINSLANIRDYLVTFISDLLITTSNSIILQSTSLVQLTQSTNQLTRSLLTIASNRCYELSFKLYSIRTKIAYEDVQLAVNQLLQCASNVLSAVNGPLQERTQILDLDYSRANTITSDYDTDLESSWSNLNLFANGNDFSQKIIEKNRNVYYQKQLAKEINKKVNEINSLLSLTLIIHRNLGQNFLLNTSQTFLLFQTISIESLSNFIFNQIENSQLIFPSNFILNSTTNSSISIRGQTLNKVVIDLKLPKDTDDIAAVYVPLSRVKRLTDLIILRHFDYKVLLIKPSKSQVAEMQRLDKLYMETQMRFSEWFQQILQNISDLHYLSSTCRM